MTDARAPDLWEPDLRALNALIAQPDIARILGVLDGDGEETRIVGGAVRNALIGRPIDDIDLATTAEPPVVMARAKRAGFGAVPTGIAHGTVTVLVDRRPFEVTTLRRDIATDGRHATVAFGRDFDEDARRRDFTMNALSLSRDGTLHDPVGGLRDLRARRVRFIGDARTRIAEDFLRILRLFRFHAAYGEGALDEGARDAAIWGRFGLARLSAERLNVEMTKLLVATRAPEALGEMADAGLLERVIGGVPLTARFSRAIAIAEAVQMPADPVARLAALAVLVAEDAQRLRQRLRLSNQATKRLEELSAILDGRHAKPAPSQAEVDALLFRAVSRGAVQDALVLLQADSGAAIDDAGWQDAQRRAAQAPVLEFPISGDDLLRRGVAPGRRVGAAPKALQARWIRAGFPRDPAILTQLVDEVLRGVDGSLKN